MPFSRLSTEQLNLLWKSATLDSLDFLGDSRATRRLVGRIISDLKAFPKNASVERIGSLHKAICGNLDSLPPEYSSDLHASGCIRSAPCGTKYFSPSACIALRQLAALVWKADSDDVHEDFKGFVDRITKSGTPSLYSHEIKRAHARLKSWLGDAPSYEEMRGRSGPGAVAERLNPADRWDFIYRPIHIPDWFFRWNDNHQIEYTWGPGITRVLSVPKDARSRRYISSEPAAYMYTQLAVMDELDRRVRKNRRFHLTNQNKHRSLLFNPEYRTIDLSDASDYISLDLVKSLFPQDWLQLLLHARSSYCRLPDGELHPISAFAPMGSGLCFHVMTLVIGALMHSPNHPFHVYGDDIICHQSVFAETVDILTRAGLKVNAVKSCQHGYYVESCGLELSLGIDVTPVFLRKAYTLRKSVRYPAVSEALRLELRGYRRTAAVVASWYSSSFNKVVNTKVRWSRTLHRLECYHPNRSVPTTEVPIDGYSGMLRWVSMQTHTRPSVATQSGLYFGYSDSSSCPWCDLVTRRSLL